MRDIDGGNLIRMSKKDGNKSSEVALGKRDKQSLASRILGNWQVYLMLLPVIVWYIVFLYLPMGGATLAFKEYKFNEGVFGSPWVGFEHFIRMFQDEDFWRATKNTLIFSGGRLLIQFPIGIIVALLLNEMRQPKAKKFFQTVYTFPHFISWIVLSGILINMFSSAGIINQILGVLGMDRISPLTNPATFRWFIWLSNIWKEFGWDTIIYLAALTSIDPQLYEAAEIDGAGRWQKMRHVTIPGIRYIVAIMLILQIGGMMGGASFDQVFNLYSAPVYSVADTIDTYVYRQTFQYGANFGYTSAMGLFKSVINIILLLSANKIVSAMGEDALF